MGQNLFMLRRGSPMRPHNESDAPFVWTSSVYVLLDDSRAFIFTPSNRVGATHPVHEQSTPHYPIARECQRCAPMPYSTSGLPITHHYDACFPRREIYTKTLATASHSKCSLWGLGVVYLGYECLTVGLVFLMINFGSCEMCYCCGLHFLTFICL